MAHYHSYIETFDSYGNKTEKRNSAFFLLNLSIIASYRGIYCSTQRTQKWEVFLFFSSPLPWKKINFYLLFSEIKWVWKSMNWWLNVLFSTPVIWRIENAMSASHFSLDSNFKNTSLESPAKQFCDLEKIWYLCTYCQSE